MRFHRAKVAGQFLAFKSCARQFSLILPELFCAAQVAASTRCRKSYNAHDSSLRSMAWFEHGRSHGHQRSGEPRSPASGYDLRLLLGRRAAAMMDAPRDFKSPPPVYQVDPEPRLEVSTHRDSGGFGDSTAINNPRIHQRPGLRLHSHSKEVAAIAPDKVAPVIAGPQRVRGTHSQLS